ncbi:MAG: hypothetical protein IT292_10305 [Deltaproteobacteria bacterium]|nr:hypothetical protein [Deltaproteobacteria bacterium]
MAKEPSVWEKREMAAVDKKIEAFDKAAHVIQQKEKAKQRRERVFIYSGLGFVALFVLGVWLSEGRLIDKTMGAMRAIDRLFVPEAGNATKSCKLAANRNTPYCQNRLGNKRSQWKNLTGHGEKGGAGQFSLHGK